LNNENGDGRAKPMNHDFDALVNEAEEHAKAMQGWDFSYVKGRRHSDRHPWDYIDTVCSVLDGVRDMLDMETGGGKNLLRIKERAKDWPDHVSATEGYKPNVAVASRNLQPIGVEVFERHLIDKLPLEDEAFDLITNRHGDYFVPEVKRILRTSGVFITQQIGFGTKVSINTLLEGPDPAYEQISFAEIVSRFEGAGFEIIIHQEFNGCDVFDDIGALVFVLTAAPWEVPGFSVERYHRKLCTLHESILSDGPIDLGISYLLLAVRKRSADSPQ
jgi:SAM-dependent methyltransferase